MKIRIIEPARRGAARIDRDPSTVGLSKTQADVVAKLTEHQAVLVRWPGGFWTYEGCPAKPGDARNDAVPEWWVTVQTVRALDRAGVLVRLGRHPEEWQDARALVSLRT